MNFVSNRDIVIHSKLGHSIEFKKGAPTHVPRIMHGEVMDKGILPVEDDGSPVKAGEAEVGNQEVKILIAPDDQFERNDKILAVIKEIVKRNNPADFTGGGMPSPATISMALGWKVNNPEVRKVWEEVRQELLKT